MKNIKCACARAIHIFSHDGGKCPFCDAAIDIDKATGLSFEPPKTFLNELIAKIDDSIANGKYDVALKLLEDVLEWAPKESEVHWRKLLATAACKSDADMLYKGSHLKSNASFVNAQRYATDDQRAIYALIDKAREQIMGLLITALKEGELEEKQATGAETLLTERTKELASIWKLSNENLAKLERTERAIREQEIDCAAIANGFKKNLENTSNKAKAVGNQASNTKNISTITEITKENQTKSESNLHALLNNSNIELNNLKGLAASHPAFQEYTRLVEEQKSLQTKINQGIADLDSVKLKIQEIVENINGISAKYSAAWENAQEGDFAAAAKLLTKTKFAKIVKQGIASA